jgi:hypothetical protein
MKFISDDLKRFIDLYFSEKKDSIKANNSI